MKRTLTIGTCLAICTLAACKEESPTTSSTAKPQESSWQLASMPDNATPVKAAKETAKEGEVVAVRGRIGGSVKPFTAGSPAFVIVDDDILHCGEMGEKDHCSTPWDYCCEPRDSLNAASATIMLVDESGAPLVIDFEAAGLHPLDDIVAVGVVGPRPAPAVLTIKATKLHRVGG